MFKFLLLFHNSTLFCVGSRHKSPITIAVIQQNKNKNVQGVSIVLLGAAYKLINWLEMAAWVHDSMFATEEMLLLIYFIMQHADILLSLTCNLFTVFDLHI